MVEVVSTDDFDEWLRKLKARVGRLRIPVGRGVWELRLMFGPGYGSTTCMTGPRVILLLCGGEKATQRRGVERAHHLAEDYWSEEGKDHG